MRTVAPDFTSTPITLPSGVFDHRIDLELVLGAVVVQLALFFRPGQLPGKLDGYQVLHHWPGRASRFAKPGGILADEMARDFRVHEASLGVPTARWVCPEDHAGMVLMRKTDDSSSR